MSRIDEILDASREPLFKPFSSARETRSVPHETLKKELGFTANCNDETLMLCAKYRIENLTKNVLDLWNQIPRWIPCAERLPEKDGKYLATQKYELFGEIRIETVETFFLDGEWNTANQVLAWQPLPEPYQEPK